VVGVIYFFFWILILLLFKLGVYFSLVFMSTNLFNIDFKGKYKDISVEELRYNFEFNVDTKNSNIFLFKSEIPAMVSIIKRFALYFVSIISIFFSYFFTTFVNLSFISNKFFIILVNFSFFTLIFLLFLILLLYLLNSYFTMKNLGSAN